MVRVTFAQPPPLDDAARPGERARPSAKPSLQEFGAPNVIAIRMPLPEGGEDAASRSRDPGPRD